jgi:hypothetical protein
MGCAGLKLSEQKKYFRTERKEGLDASKLGKIGVYVFSNGPLRDGLDIPYELIDEFDQALTLPLGFLTLATVGVQDKMRARHSIHKNFFPPEIVRSLVLESDSSSEWPSMVLARAVAGQIADRGFDVEIAGRPEHMGRVSVEQCLEDARDRHYTTACIVYYTGLYQWEEVVGEKLVIYTSSSGRMAGSNVPIAEIRNGQLYLTNAALFDAASGERVWANSHYGLVQRAHLPNLESDPFVEVVSKALVSNGSPSLDTAAATAARILFNPTYWRGSFKEFPVRQWDTASGRRRF